MNNNHQPRPSGPLSARLAALRGQPAPVLPPRRTLSDRLAEAQARTLPMVGDSVQHVDAPTPVLGVVERVQVEGSPSWLMEGMAFPHVWVRWEGSADATPYGPDSLARISAGI
jgi:hypothetical protein